MACCMAEKYGWCQNDQNTRKIEGKEYCIFHAPIAEKWLTEKEIKLKVIERLECYVSINLLYDNKDASEEELGPRECDFSGANFPKIEVRLKDNKPITFKLIFKDCHFYNDAHFNGTNFSSDINFSNCFFDQHAFFNNSTFQNDINFNLCKFGTGEKYSSNFSNSTFNSLIKFEGCDFFDVSFFKSIKFLGEVEFKSNLESEKKCHFHKNTYFENSNFNKDSIFNSCVFEGIVNFDNATFSKHFAFIKNQNIHHKDKKKLTKKETYFRNCTFNGKSVFTDSKFKFLSFSLSTFNSPIFLYSAAFYEKLEIIGATFLGVFTLFNPLSIKKIEIYKSHFYNFVYISEIPTACEISFTDTICEKKIFMERVNLERMSFLNTHIESFKFIECKWKIVNNHASIFNGIDHTKGVTAVTLEEIYRRLKKNARDNLDEVQTSNWHYKEKEMQRIIANQNSLYPSKLTAISLFLIILIGIGVLNISVPKFWAVPPLFVFIIFIFKLYYDDIKNRPHWFSKIYLNLYYFSSRYGESPERAGFILTCLISSVFFYPFILDSGLSNSEEWLKCSLWFLPLMNIDTPTISKITLAPVLRVISFLLVTIQSTLFAFSLRNRLRR